MIGARLARRARRRTHELDPAFGIREGAGLLEPARGRQHQVRAPRGLRQEQLLHDEQLERIERFEHRVLVADRSGPRPRPGSTSRAAGPRAPPRASPAASGPASRAARRPTRARVARAARDRRAADSPARSPAWRPCRRCPGRCSGRAAAACRRRGGRCCRSSSARFVSASTEATPCVSSESPRPVTKSAGPRASSAAACSICARGTPVVSAAASIDTRVETAQEGLGVLAAFGQVRGVKSCPRRAASAPWPGTAGRSFRDAAPGAASRRSASSMRRGSITSSGVPRSAACRMRAPMTGCASLAFAPATTMQLRGLDVVVARARRSRAGRHAQRLGGAAVTHARTAVDVVAAEHRAKQLLQQVGGLVGRARRGQEAERIRAMAPVQLAQASRRPRRWPASQETGFSSPPSRSSGRVRRSGERRQACA